MSKKLVLVTADWAPFSGKVERLCKETAEKLGVELEVRKEDWIYLSRHGEKDELGGYDIPQIFVEEEGKVKHLLTRVPLTSEGRPDFETVRRIIEEALK